MTLTKQLAHFLRKYIHERRRGLVDDLLQARALMVDHINGRLDVLREIQRENCYSDVHRIRGLHERARELLKREAAKASNVLEIREAFGLSEKDRFCYHRYSRIIGCITEHKLLRTAIAGKLWDMTGAQK